MIGRRGAIRKTSDWLVNSPSVKRATGLRVCAWVVIEPITAMVLRDGSVYVYSLYNAYTCMVLCARCVFMVFLTLNIAGDEIELEAFYARPQSFHLNEIRNFCISAFSKRDSTRKIHYLPPNRAIE